MRTAWVLVALLACAEEQTTVAPDESASAPSSRTDWIQGRDPGSAPVMEAPARSFAAPSASAAVSMPFPGRVSRVHVAAGRVVRQGMPVVDVVMPELLHAAGEASAATLLLAAFEKRRAQLAKLEREGLARLQDVVEVESNLVEARARLEAARASLGAAGLTVPEAKALLEGDGTLSLRSPINGVVVEVNARPGEMRSPESGALAQVVGEGQVRVEARFPSTPPAGASYAFVGPDGLPIELVPESLSPQATDADAARLGWFSLGSGAALPAGLPGRVLVRLQDAEGVVALPAGAVTVLDGRPVVFVREGESPALRPVQVVASSGNTVLVRAADGEPFEVGASFAADAAITASEAP